MGISSPSPTQPGPLGNAGLSWEPGALLPDAAASSRAPIPPACCQISSAGSRVTPAPELTGTVVFLPGKASSLLNPSSGGPQQACRRGPGRELGLRPGSPQSLGTPQAGVRPLGTGQGQSRDGNYDFRKLECCLRSTNAPSLPGSTLRARGWAPGLPQGGACAHTCRCVQAHVRSHIHVHTRHTHTSFCTHMHVHSAHPPTHTHTCALMYVCT